MTYQFPPDVDRLLKAQMAAGGYASQDDVLQDALLSTCKGRPDGD